MKRLCTGMLIIPVLLIFGTLDARAEVLGARYAGVHGGYIWIGDSEWKQIDDSAYFYGMSLRLPLHRHIDLVGRLHEAKSSARMTIDEEENVKVEHYFSGFGADLQFHFLPGNEINPYVSAGFDRNRDKTKVGEEEESERDTAILMEGGVEIELDYGFSCQIGLGYYDMFGVADAYAVVSVHKWILENFMLQAGLSHVFDPGNTFLGVGIVIAF